MVLYAPLPPIAVRTFATVAIPAPHTAAPVTTDQPPLPPAPIPPSLPRHTYAIVVPTQGVPSSSTETGGAFNILQQGGDRLRYRRYRQSEFLRGGSMYSGGVFIPEEFVAEGVLRDSLEGRGGRSQARSVVACWLWWENEVLVPCVAAASHSHPLASNPRRIFTASTSVLACRQDRDKAFPKSVQNKRALMFNHCLFGVCRRSSSCHQCHRRTPRPGRPRSDESVTKSNKVPSRSAS